MIVASVVVNPDWVVFYNSLVLTIIAVSQVYLDFAIISSQRRAAKDRKLQLAKERAAAETNAHATD